MDDSELLREYVGSRSEAAFEELVRRHVDMVYSTALRRAGDSQMAKDVAQSVFIRLARKAGSLREGNALPGWLYRAACYEAISALRAEQRRRQRESEAMRLSEPEGGSSSAWTEVAPLLDAAMHKLGRVEQDAVVLRFFENKPLGEVGRMLGLSEEAARKRVSRALEKLRAHFARRGVKVASGALATTLVAHAVQAAPVGLAASLAGASLSAGTAGAAGLVSTFIQALLMTKTTATILTVLVVGAAITPLLLRHRPAPEPMPPAETSNLATPAVTPTPEPPAEPRPAPATAAAFKEPTAPLLMRAGMLPPLTPAQIEAYVVQNKRNAESLLAAYRISTKLAYLTEAAAQFPTNPEVQYAVIAARASPEVQRQWIDAYKTSSPDNALAWYFSALEYFKAGQPAQAVQELAEATRKPAFRAELAPTLQAVEEMNVSAGRAADEAKVLALQNSILMPHLPSMKGLSQAMQEAAQQYQQQGDKASADSLAGMGLVLGNHLSAGGGSQTIINQLVGIAIEKRFLRLLDPNGVDPFGRPVAEVSAAVAQHQDLLKGYSATLLSLTPSFTDAELANYLERVKLYGEEAAVTWLKAKHEQK